MGAVNHTGTSATLSSLKGLKWESSTLYSLIWEIQMKTFQDFGIEVGFHCVVVQNLPNPELLVTQHHQHSFKYFSLKVQVVILFSFFNRKKMLCS